MKRFVEGVDREQGTLFPDRLEDWIGDDNPVRVVDVFVDELDLGGLGFDRVAPLATGRPGYHPSVLLKLYIYGYLNRVQSSRRLEHEAGRNVEVMWLTGRLVPDHKTIGERLVYRYTNVEKGLTLHRYWTNACRTCAIKDQCTTGKERRVTRWEHEHVLEAVQQRLDEHPEKMRQRRQTVEHPFGTIKFWMGSTHFQMKTLKRVGTEMALHVLAYNLKRVMSILGIGPLIAAMSAA